MAWSYDRDMELLSKVGVDNAMVALAKHNAYMALSADDTGGKECLLNTARFYEICKEKICVAIDEKVKDLKERANNVK